VPHKTFPEPARAALAAGTIGAALFFSAATARRFAQLARTARVADRLKDVDALALSPAVAAPLAALPWRRICVAARPDQDSLMTLLADEAE
jgi:uroporphyrinogen-III synthase